MPTIDLPLQRVGTVEVPLPRYASLDAAGMDLHAAITKTMVLESLDRVLIPTGLSVALPRGYEGQVRPRSGLALKRGLTILNAPGTIDADYRGEIGVLLVNLSREPARIEPLERIAQLVVAKVERATLREVSELEATARGSGGYGSTGTT